MSDTTLNNLSPERVLILYRPCSNQRFVKELLKRGTGIFCPPKDRDKVATHQKMFTWKEWLRLRRELAEGRYDAVVCFGLAEGLWRPGRFWLSNVLKLIKRFFTSFASFGPHLLLPTITKYRVPLIVYEWEDSQAIARKNWPLLEACTLYYKTQCPVNLFKAFLWQDKRNECVFNVSRSPRYQKWAQKIRPLSYGVTEVDYLADCIAPEKTVDVFFAGGVSYSWIRPDGLRQLRELAQEEGVIIDIPDKAIPHREYLQRMSRAWLVFSPEGAEWDCTRHHESLLVGTVPVINQPNIRRYKPYLDGEHALYYNVEEDGLKKVIRAALADKERLRAIGRCGAEHTRRYHLHTRLADAMLSAVQPTVL